MLGGYRLRGNDLGRIRLYRQGMTAIAVNLPYALAKKCDRFTP